MLGACRGALLPRALLPLGERVVNAIDDGGLNGLDGIEARSRGTGQRLGVRANVVDQLLDTAPSGDARADDAREEVRRELVEVATVAGAARALGNAAVEEPPRVSADAGLADAELRGELVERLRLWGEHQQGEQSPGDWREAVSLGGIAEAVDEHALSPVHGECENQDRSVRTEC